MKREAHRILRANDMGIFIAPTTNGLYPAQWNWDSAFVALALARMGDIERAWLEIESLLSAQWRSGMVPHIVFHIDDTTYFPNSSIWQAGETIPSSGITQPPVLANFIRLMLDEHGGEESVERVRRLFPKLFAWHKWYHEVRDPSGAGLVTIVHPWESGFDNNPVFDEALHRVPVDGVGAYSRKDTLHAAADQRPASADYDGYVALLQLFRRHGYDQAWMARHSPFRVADVGVNAMLLRADHDLEYLATLTGHQNRVSEIAGWIARGADGLRKLWTPELGMFCALDQVSGKPVRLPSVTGFTPIFSGPLPPDRISAMASAIEGWLGRSPFGLPSFDPDHRLFDPRRYCRGPCWFMWSWVIGRGLGQNGRENLEREIRERCIALAGERGFFEYYDPTTGEGCGGTDFSWTAAVAVLLATDADAGR